MSPWGIHSTAREFHRAFQLCYGNGLPAKHGVPNALVPGIVCLVFAIELGLKAVHASDGSPQSGHSLSMLFEKLSDDSKAQILSESGIEGQSFRENLAEVSNAFVEWRYVHEAPGSRSINVQFLEGVWSAVNAVANRRADIERAAIRAARERKGEA